MAEMMKLKSKHFTAYASLQMNAYPVMGHTERDRDNLVSRLEARGRDPRVSYWGLMDEGHIIGGMRLHDFTLNFRGLPLEAGGVGGVAVDLAHKKKKVAKQLMEFYLNHYREKNNPLAVLWPFRPDFYRQMGFGYGSKVHRYTIKPADLPDSDLRRQVRFLTEHDIEAATTCYNKFAMQRNGMIEENEQVVAFQLNLDGPSKAFGFEENGELTGYMTLIFTNRDPNNFLAYDARVGYFVYNSRNAFLGLMSFLRSQADQVRHIILDAGEPSLEFLMHDPRDHSGVLIPSVYHQSQVAGVGVMYRVIDLKMLFEQISRPVFGAGEMTVELNIRDSFMSSNPESLIVSFRDGMAEAAPDATADVRLSMDISDFSSMIMGAVSLKELYRYSRADLSSENLLDALNALFMADEGTFCMTDF